MIFSRVSRRLKRLSSTISDLSISFKITSSAFSKYSSISSWKYEFRHLDDSNSQWHEKIAKSASWGTGSKNLILGRTILSKFVGSTNSHFAQLALSPTGTTPNCRYTIPHPFSNKFIFNPLTPIAQKTPQIFDAYLLENTNLSPFSFPFSVNFISRLYFESYGLKLIRTIAIEEEKRCLFTLTNLYSRHFV